jgi:galactitol-specific phosphotransferase system IIB component
MDLFQMKKEKSRKKKILCSCGACIKTCEISDQIVEFLAENGIDAEIIKCNTFDIEHYYKETDLIISACQLPPRIDRPKISSVPFFTGIGLEEAKKQILQILK